MGEALKYDDGKPDLSLLPPPALRAVARVLMHGAEKYGRDNWKGGMRWSRLYAASMRHILEHMEGEREDPETGESPLAHAICGLMFLLIYELEGLGEDDLNGNTDSDDGTWQLFVKLNDDLNGVTPADTPDDGRITI